jgi:hypothetical protein
LAACAECRAQHDAARRLLEGLGALPRPAAPENLGTRIVAGVLRDLHGRQTLRRRFWIGMSLAASIVLMVLGGYLLFGPGDDGPGPIAKKDEDPPKPAPKEKPPALGESLAEARQAVAGLTGRLADTTRDQAKLWLAAASALPPAVPMQPPEQPFDPAALRQTSQGVSEGVQTVARSTRRAMDYFLREFAPTDASAKN